MQTSLANDLVVIGLALLVLAWALLPLAMFGIKPLLRELIREQRAVRELLERVHPDAAPKVQANEAVY